jgi:hypothetical protein
VFIPFHAGILVHISGLAIRLLCCPYRSLTVYLPSLSNLPRFAVNQVCLLYMGMDGGTARATPVASTSVTCNDCAVGTKQGLDTASTSGKVM